MAKNSAHLKFISKAPSYILTLISRLDTVICFNLFRYFNTNSNQDYIVDLLVEKNIKLEDKEEDIKNIIKKVGKTNKEININYPFDIFGVSSTINFLHLWKDLDDFVKFISKEMIVYIKDKNQIINHLANIFLLRQALEHPDKKDVDNSITINNSIKIKFNLEKSLESLFIFIPESFINNVVQLLKTKEDTIINIKEKVLKTNKNFRKRLNLQLAQENSKKNKQETKNTNVLNQTTFNNKKAFAFMGEVNKTMLNNIVSAEINKLKVSANKKQKKQIFFDTKNNKIQNHELFLMFNFILEVQSTFRRYFCPLFVNENKYKKLINENLKLKEELQKYKTLRDYVSHSHLFFNKQSRPYIKVACENIELALNFFDTQYNVTKNTNPKDMQNKGIEVQKDNNNNNITKAQIKTDFIRSLKAICNKKDYFYIKMETPKSNNKGVNTQIIEIGAEHCKNFNKNNINLAIQNKIQTKKQNSTLQNSIFTVQKRIYLNFIRQKIKKEIVKIKKENKTKNSIEKIIN